MNAVTFSNAQSINKTLFVSYANVPDAGWCAYLYPGNPEQAKDEFTLEETWNNSLSNGIYLFTTKEPSISQDELVERVQAFRKKVGLSDSHCYLMWIGHLDNPLTDDNVNFLQIQTSMTGSYQISNDANFNFGQLVYFSILKNCSIRLDKTLNHFVIQKSFGNIYFSNTLSQPDANIVNDTLYLPFDGSSQGAFRFRITFNGTNSLDHYNVGLRYYYPSSVQGKVKGSKYPLFDRAYKGLFSCQASLDPIKQINENDMLRTFLAFDQNQQIVPSYLRTDTGHSVLLKPTVSYIPNTQNLPYDQPDVGCAMLVFSYQQQGKLCTALPFYMLPQGDFAIVEPMVNIDNPMIRLMCGLSGVETVACMPQTKDYGGDVIRFQPNRAAFASNFGKLDRDKDTYQHTNLLDDSYVTAWASVRASAGRPALVSGNDTTIRYLAQPDGAPLYYVKDQPEFMDFFQPTAAVLEGHELLYYPLVPYAGISGKLDPDMQKAIKEFDLQILIPARKAMIDQATLPEKIERFTLLKAGALASAEDKDVTPSTTPQGLYVEVTDRGDWNRLTLAKNIKSPDPHSPDYNMPLSMEFVHLHPELRSAFQTNQQFLVVSLNQSDPNDPNSYLLGEFHNEMCIEGWPFTVNVPTAKRTDSYDNLLIFKFGSGTLAERAKNPQLWTNPELFNDKDQLNNLADWLNQYIQKGIDNFEKKGDLDFQNFSQIVQDPNWNGILALNCDISVKNFPEQLKGLLGGIDESKFKAHHFGINVNHVTTDAQGKLSMDTASSMFALIDYEDSGNAPVPQGDDFAFSVLKLKVRFENSKISSFNSKLQLTVNRLFGSEVQLTTTGGIEIPANIIVFHGTYEDHNGNPTYTFNSIEECKFYLDSNVLNSVEVIKANFSTISSDQQDTLVHSRFAFWGYFDFHSLSYTLADKSLQSYDIFSFGSEQGRDKNDVQVGLAFYNLEVQMAFDLEDTSSKRSFTFDPSHISFDPGQSITRSNSLYAHFPVQIEMLSYGGNNHAPSSDGYLGVETPLKLTTLSNEWYGLVFTLSLGSLGALAASAGLVANLVMCWSPNSRSGDSAYSVFVGLKLPGVSSESTMLSIQGVLKLGINHIRLMKSDQNAYLLMLNDISLKFLGKKITPNSELDFYLFGNPDSGAKAGSLGWYAAYQKKGGA